MMIFNFLFDFFKKKRVQKISLDKIINSITTLEGNMPELILKTDAEPACEMHEDDWRQIEFVSKSQKPAIDEEIAKIKDVYDNHCIRGNGYIGFKKISVRTLITKPLAIDFFKIKTYLANKDIRTGGVSFFGFSDQIINKAINGFSFLADGIIYYGELGQDNKVKWLCVSWIIKKDVDPSAGKLSKLLAEENLYLVDWQRREIFDEANIGDFIKRQD